METQNLWPDFVVEKTKSPKVILKEQAGFLMEKTKNVLSAEIETSQSKGQMMHVFYVVAPAIDNYRYKLFSVSHKVVSYYPLAIEWDGYGEWGIPDQDADDQDEFIRMLGQILRDDHTTKIISSLLSQSLSE